MAMNIVDRIDSLVSVRHVLVSVSDKGGLDTFIPKLVALNPNIKFFSTGGTYGRIQEILGDSAGSHLTQVSDYTGQPEIQCFYQTALGFRLPRVFRYLGQMGIR